KRRVPAIRVTGNRRVLGNRTWNSNHKIRQRILGHAVIKSEDAVVVEQRLLNVFVERDFSAELQRVFPLIPTEHVADRIKVSACGRSTNRVCQSEETTYSDLRQGRRTLDRKCGTQVAERRRRQIQATAKISRASRPNLIDLGGADDPDIAGVDIMLSPIELLTGPRQVAASCFNPVRARRLEVAERQSMLAIELMIDLG